MGLSTSSHIATDDKGGAARRKGGEHERVAQRLLSAGRRVGARRILGAARGAEAGARYISATYVAVGCSSLGLHRGLSRLNLTRLEAGSCGAASQVGLPEDEGGGGDDEADGGDGEADGGGGGGEAEGGGGVGAATLTTVIFAFMRECGPQK